MAERSSAPTANSGRPSTLGPDLSEPPCDISLLGAAAEDEHGVLPWMSLTSSSDSGVLSVGKYLGETSSDISLHDGQLLGSAWAVAGHLHPRHEA